MPVLLGTRTSSNFLPLSSQLPDHNGLVETLKSGWTAFLDRAAPFARAFPKGGIADPIHASIAAAGRLIA